MSSFSWYAQNDLEKASVLHGFGWPSYKSTLIMAAQETRYALVLIMAQEGSILAFYGIIMNTQRLKNIECSQTFQMFPSPRQPNWNVNNVALLITLKGCVATLIRGSLSQPLSLQPNWWTWVVFSWSLRLASAMRQVDVPGHHVMPSNFIFLIKRKADNAIISVKW